MSVLNTPAYYRRREQQERALADKAISPAIANIHLELADRYVALADDADPGAFRSRLAMAG